jgi:NAD+-dependent protein deacetylase SIR2
MNRYPSPLSTVPSGSASPRKTIHAQDADSICVNPDGAPPPKRRKIEPKPRTTEHLSLDAASDNIERDEELLAQLTTALRKKKKIVVVAGAGISVSAGIPDFRSSDGLFKTLRTQHKLKASGKQLFDASVYMHNSSTSTFHDMVRELADQTKIAKPTPFHHMLASIAKEGRLLRLYSQNVDGIDTAMEPLATAVPLNPKGPWPKTIQLHGGLGKMVCSKCNEISDFDGSLFDGPEAPLCKGCEVTDNVRTAHAGKRSHGIGRLRPRMVLYNEYNPDEDAIVKVVKADMSAKPDALIVVGTSMKIPGVRKIVKDMSKVVRGKRGGLTAWINLDPEPSGVELKDCWDLVVCGKSDDVATMVALPRWDESPELSGDDLEGHKTEDMPQNKLEVHLPSSPEMLPSPLKLESDDGDFDVGEAKLKSVEKVQGIPTPTASPKARTALPTRQPIKTKQSQLVFRGESSKDSIPLSPTTATNAAKKPRARKPRQKKTDQRTGSRPTTTVKTAFKATKATTAVQSSKGPAKRALDPDTSNRTPVDDQRSSPVSGSVLTPRSAPVDMKLTIGTPDQENVSSSPPSRSLQKQQNDASLYQHLPATPTETEPPSCATSATISPPSKPRGMRNLID